MTRKKPKKIQHSSQPSTKPSGKASYVIYGKHPVEAVLRNKNRKIIRILATKTPDNTIATLAQHRGHSIQMVEMRQIAPLIPEGVPHQGIIAEIAPLEADLPADLSQWKRVVVLDQVTDPHNVGAILRSCAAFDVDALITSKDHAPPETASLAKSASGALEHVPYIRVTNLAVTLTTLKDAGFWVLGMDGEATTTLSNAPRYERTVLVMGAEGNGMRRLTREHCDVLVKLEVSSKVESLNVSNACAIALYTLR